MTSEKVLLLSYAFPPLAAPESSLVAKLMGNLEGMVCDVIASRPWARHGVENSLLDYVEDHFGLIKRLSPPWWVERLPEYRLPGQPDAMRYMTKRTVNAAEDLGLGQYTAIITWSQWHSAHLAGLELKRRHHELPWIAHLSDPWVDNPFVNYDRRARKTNLAMERKVFEACDAIVFTSTETTDLVMVKHPPSWGKKVHVIPHVFDEQLLAQVVAHDDKAKDGKVLRYLGNFYGRRTPEPLFTALAAILDDAPHLLDKVRFEVVGKAEPDMMDSEAYHRLPEGMVKFIGSVDYCSSLSLMAGSDGLLVIDAPADISVFLPSKLIDYIGAGKPIIGFTPPGTSENLIKRYGGWAADPKDDRSCATALTQALEHIKSKGKAPDETVRREFEVAEVGRAKAKLIREVAEHVGRHA